MKKAMSPLFSTIILIGFAIALGGIVMSWGKSSYSIEHPQGCDTTSLSLISYGEKQGACFNGNKISFTIQNNGEMDLTGVKVFVMGGEEVHSTIVEEPIYVADIKKLDVDYSSEMIEKLIFVPVFDLYGAQKLCPKNGFSIEDISGC